MPVKSFTMITPAFRYPQFSLPGKDLVHHDMQFVKCSVSKLPGRPTTCSIKPACFALLCCSDPQSFALWKIRHGVSHKCKQQTPDSSLTDVNVTSTSCVLVTAVTDGAAGGSKFKVHRDDEVSNCTYPVRNSPFCRQKDNVCDSKRTACLSLGCQLVSICTDDVAGGKVRG